VAYYLLELLALGVLILPTSAIYLRQGLVTAVSLASSAISSVALLMLLEICSELVGYPLAPWSLLVAHIVVTSTILFVQDSLGDTHSAIKRPLIVITLTLFAVSLLGATYRHVPLTPDSVMYLMHDRLYLRTDLNMFASPEIRNRGLGPSSYNIIAPLFHDQIFRSFQLTLALGCIISAVKIIELYVSKRSSFCMLSLLLVGLLISTDRFLVMVFYLNSHIIIATAVTLSVYALLVTRSNVSDSNTIQASTNFVAGVALGVIAISRAEGLITSIIVLCIGYSSLNAPVMSISQGQTRDLRIAHFKLVRYATVPFALIAGCWFLALGVNSSPAGLLTSVTGTLQYSSAGFALGLLALASPSLLESIFYLFERNRVALFRAAFIALFGISLLYFKQNLLLLLDSNLVPILQNLLTRGSWGFFWLFVGVILAATAGEFTRHDRFWKHLIGWNLVFYVLLGIVRGHPYRIGPGDSFNRMLTHFLPLIVVYVVTRVYFAAQRDSQPSEIGGSSHVENN